MGSGIATVFVAAVLGGIAIWQARQANTWAKRATELQVAALRKDFTASMIGPLVNVDLLPGSASVWIHRVAVWSAGGEGARITAHQSPGSFDACQLRRAPDRRYLGRCAVQTPRRLQPICNRRVLQCFSELPVRKRNKPSVKPSVQLYLYMYPPQVRQ